MCPMLATTSSIPTPTTPPFIADTTLNFRKALISQSSKMVFLIIAGAAVVLGVYTASMYLTVLGGIVCTKLLWENRKRYWNELTRRILRFTTLTRAYATQLARSTGIHRYADNPIGHFLSKINQPWLMEAGLVISSMLTAALAFTAWINLKKNTAGVLKHTVRATLVSAIVAATLQMTNFLGMASEEVIDPAVEALINRAPDVWMMEAPSGLQPQAGLDVIISFLSTLVAAICAAWNSKKPLSAIFGHIVQNWSKTQSGSKSLIEQIKSLWTAVCPDAQTLDSLNRFKADTEQLGKIAIMTNGDFVKGSAQHSIAEIVKRHDDEFIKTLNLKEDAVAHLEKRWTYFHAKCVTRQTELASTIKAAAKTRRLPVFWSLFGKRGHGKSYILKRLYEDIAFWAAEQRICDGLLSRLVGSSSGQENFLPPMSDEMWYEINEYIRCWDDPWVGAVNNLVSDDPTIMSSAFEKFFIPSPHFIVSTSNLKLPFKFPTTSSNFMRPEVLDAWFSRHQFIEVELAGYDDSKTRYEQDRSVPPVMKLYKDNGNSQFTSQVITYEWLLEETKRQWKRNDQTFKDDQRKLDELIAKLPKFKNDPEPQTFGNPAVLSVFGPPGGGKTYLLNTDILPRLSLTNKAKHYARVPPSPDRTCRLHIFDDCIGPHDDWMAYKTFYDACTAEDIIIVIDNWTPRTTTRISWPVGWPSWYEGCWKDLAWWKKFLHRTTDISELPHVSLGRRLGLTAAHMWRGQRLCPAVSRLESVYFGPIGAHSFNDPHRIVKPVDEFVNAWITDVQMAKTLTRVPLGDVPAPTGGYDLQVRLSDISLALQAYVHPTSTEYVKVNLMMARAFPDYTSVFVIDPHVPDRDKAVYDVLSTAYRRQPFNAHLRYDDFEVRLVDGKYGSNAAQTQHTRLATIDSDHLSVVINGVSRRHTFLDISKHSVDVSGYTPEDQRWLAQQFDALRATYAFRQHVSNYRFNAYRDMLEARVKSATTSAIQTIKANPKLSVLIGAVSVVATVAMGYAVFRGSSSSDDEDKEPKPESTSGGRTELYIKRTPIAPTRALPESVTGGRIVLPVQKTPITSSTEAKPQSLVGLDLRGTFPPEVENVRKKLEKAYVLVITPLGQNYGIMVGNKSILTVSHCCETVGDQASIVETVDGKITWWTAVCTARDSTRDLAILTVKEHTWPVRSDLTSYFLKDSDLVNLFALLQIMPDGTVITTDATFHDYFECAASKTPSWHPTRRLILADNLQTTRWAQAGDCGTAYITPRIQNGKRLIAGIHIAGYNNDNRGIAASVTQEDLHALLQGMSPQNGPSPFQLHNFSIGERDFLVESNVSDLILSKPVHAVSVLPENDRIKEIAEVGAFYSPSHRRGGRLVRTPMSKFIEAGIPNIKLPAPVSFNDPVIARENLDAMAKDVFGRPSIGISQLAKIAGPLGPNPPDHFEISEELIAVVTDTMIAKMSTWDGIDRWHPLTLEEALNGQQDPYFGGVFGKIKTDTSPGFPFKQLYNVNSKGAMLNIDPDGYRSINATPAGMHLAHATSALWADAVGADLTNRDELLHVVEAHLKVETILAEKAAAGKTRLFYVEAADHIIFQRRIFGCYHALAVKNRWRKHCHHTTGINPHNEFQHLYQRLKRKGNKGGEWDYERFDKRAPKWAQEVLRRIVAHFAIKNKWHSDETICTRMAERGVRSLFKKWYLFEGILFESDCDWSSGNAMTNPIGSALNDCYIVAAASTILHEETGAYPTAEEIDNFLDWFTHGDDVAYAVHSCAEAIFTFRRFKEVMSTLGLTITPTVDKTGASYDLIPVEDITFIGRSFEMDKNNPLRPFGKLRESALNGMLHWTEDPTKAQMFAVLDGLFYELRAHDEATYNHYRDVVGSALTKLRWVYAIPPFSAARLSLIRDRDGAVDILNLSHYLPY